MDKRMTDAELVKKYQSDFLSIDKIGETWSVKRVEYEHKDVECDDEDECENKKHFRKIVKTEWRNSSLRNALREAGYEQVTDG